MDHNQELAAALVMQLSNAGYTVFGRMDLTGWDVYEPGDGTPEGYLGAVRFDEGGIAFAEDSEKLADLPLVHDYLLSVRS